MFSVLRVSASERHGGKTESALPALLGEVVLSSKQTRLSGSLQSLTMLL